MSCDSFVPATPGPDYEPGWASHSSSPLSRTSANLPSSGCLSHKLYNLCTLLIFSHLSLFAQLSNIFVLTLGPLKGVKFVCYLKPRPDIGDPTISVWGMTPPDLTLAAGSKAGRACIPPRLAYAPVFNKLIARFMFDCCNQCIDIPTLSERNTHWYIEPWPKCM